MALLKYGHENFTFEIVEYCKPNEAVILEQTYLDKFDFDYNINANANSILGYKHTEETLAKMKGRQNFKGKTHSEETKQISRDLAAKKRKNKQLNNKVKLSDLFKQVSSDGITISRSAHDLSKLKKLKIMDISNNQSIIFKTVSVASYVLCAAESTLLNYAKNGNLFSYFE